MIAYDPNIIGQFAEKLYDRAAAILLTWTLLGGLSGGVLGLSLGMSASRDFETALLPALIVAAVGAVVGYILARDRAFLLRLQAQQALCQLQIEQNTRAMAYGANTVQRAA